jgi:hypothetical protein
MEGRKERRKEKRERGGREGGKKEGRKEARKKGRDYLFSTWFPLLLCQRYMLKFFKSKA